MVMEQELGRPLLPQETVHHRNGQKADNRLANLELWTSSHPPGQRVTDLVEWAVELLRLYSPHIRGAGDVGEIQQSYVADV